MISAKDCYHETLQFASGDYYIMCIGCGAQWMRRGLTKKEYGTDANGEEIGAAPSESNIGYGAMLSGSRRHSR